MKEDDTYGFTGTALWFLAIMVISIIVQGVVADSYLTYPEAAPSEEQLRALELNGDVVTSAMLASGIIGTFLVLLAIKLKKSASIEGYLGLMKVRPSVYINWGLILALFIVASEALTYLLGKDSTPEDMIIIYQTASQKWLLWVAIVLVAPVFEEVFFRGFLLGGLASSFMGSIGAVFTTSVLWTILHIQYEAYYLGIIFVMGLLFGYIRQKTGSLFIPILLHMAANFVATFQMYLLQP